MKTSYFASPKIRSGNFNLVSISRKPPEWFANTNPLRIYKPLCPSWGLVMSYKQGKITAKQYTERYYYEILNKLNPEETYKQLGEDSVLLCYETPGEFCHRRIVAYWFLEYINIEVNEL